MLRLSWCQFHQDCQRLAGKLREADRQYDKMICITRGGVFVGGLLAHFLGIRNITTIALTLYEGSRQGSGIVELSAPDMPKPGSSILVVDDLLDSGRTLAYIMEKWGNDYEIDSAVLYDKGGGELRPDFAAMSIPDEWVWFPWEMSGD